MTMNSNKRSVCVLLFLILTQGAACSVGQGSGDVPLWPEIEPFKTGYLKVSDIHEIYYEQCGNPEGVPVFMLHGGPGGSSSPYMRRFCDPEKYHMILHDQRGSGKSKPYAEVRENTTQNLVGDIEKLRKNLEIDSFILWGGSWGATLALAYAESYPEHVNGMILRGTFAATDEEIDYFYHGGVATYFPDVYEKFTGALPDPDRRPLPAYLYELISTDDPDERMFYSKVWASYEAKISVLEISDEEVAAIWEQYNPISFSLLENYYMSNRCFLEEGQLIKNTDKLKNIPIIFINGRYDTICPTKTAHKLHGRLPNSRLKIVESAGHWLGDPNMERALLQAMKELE